MTPWAYTDDYSVPFNVARSLLGETDPETARVSDQAITSAMATFGFQRGVAMLAQRLIVEIGQEVTAYAEQGGSSAQWGPDRLAGLRAVKAAGEAGTLPDPESGPVEAIAPGSIWLGNSPEW